MNEEIDCHGLLHEQGTSIQQRRRFASTNKTSTAPIWPELISYEARIDYLARYKTAQYVCRIDRWLTRRGCPCWHSIDLWPWFSGTDVWVLQREFQPVLPHHLCQTKA